MTKSLDNIFYKPWRVRPTLPLDELWVIYTLMINRIRFWNERDGYHMLNEREEEVWCSWNKNDNWL